MRLGIRSKLFLLSFGMVAVALLAADLLLTRALDRSLTERFRADLMIRAAMAERAASRLGEDPAHGPSKPWQELAQDLGRRARARLTFIAADGRVLGDSEVAPADIAALENHGGRPEVREAATGVAGASVRHSATLGQRMLYVAVPLVRAGMRAGVVRLALPLAEVDLAVARFRGILLGASLGALGLAALLSSLAVQWASRPLRQLTEASSRMAGVDPGGRGGSSGGDEVAALGHSLDRLAGDLARALEQLKAEHHLLEAIFEGMNEGVMVVSGDGRILHANPALRDLLLVGADAVGRPLLDAVRNARLMEVLDRARQRPEGAGDEIETGGLKPRRLQVQARLLAGQPGDLLVVLVDVTQLRHLESVRRDFVANASHELRTPVASIRSSAETLQGLEDPEARQTFLAIIERNAVRLHQLVEDLLDLSRIEAREFRLDPQPVELGGFVEGMVDGYRTQASARTMRLLGEPSLQGLRVRADRRALEQVLGNLLDNALKYGSPGSAVRVSASAVEGRLRVSVADEGPGIEPQHLPRLFERFYRVDAGRSRELGGTGLGLAIVKNLVEAMGGTVQVDSQPGQGSTFSFLLPAWPEQA